MELKGLTDLSGLTWPADGTGWFVSLNTTIGKHLYYVYLDGRRVAYLDRIVAANAWMIERR